MRAIYLILFSIAVILPSLSLAIPGNERGGGDLPEGEPKKLVEWVKRQIFESIRWKSVPLDCVAFNGRNLSKPQMQLCSLINETTLSHSYSVLMNHPSAEFGNHSDVLNLFEARDRFEVSMWILGQPEKVQSSGGESVIYSVPVVLEVRIFDCVKPVYLNFRLNWDGDKLLF